MNKDYWWRLSMRVTMSAVWPPRTRRILLRSLGLRTNHTMSIPDGVFIGSTKVYLSDHVGINIGTVLDGCGELFLGPGVRLGIGVTVLTGDHPIENAIQRRDPGLDTVAKNTRIERGCWLASNVTVLPGVTIAEGCVIAAGSVVTKDTQANGLYAGVPARRVSDLQVDTDRALRLVA